MEPNIVYFSLGSNLGDRKQHIENAMDHIHASIGAIAALSSYYETSAWGFESDQPFYNRAIKVETRLKAMEILEQTEEIERSLGRNLKSTHGNYVSRAIDIDLLFYNDEVIDLPRLKIPHLRMEHRLFELIPMGEINGNYIHPLLQQSVRQLIDACNDAGEVRKLT